MHQVDLRLRGLDPGFGFLLEGMHHPDILPDLHRVNDAVGVRPEPQGQLKDTAAEAFQRLGDLWMPAFGHKGQRPPDFDLRPVRKPLEIPSGGFQPRYRPGSYHNSILSYLTKKIKHDLLVFAGCSLKHSPAKPLSAFLPEHQFLVWSECPFLVPALQTHQIGAPGTRQKRPLGRDRTHAQLFPFGKASMGRTSLLTGEDAEIRLDAVGAFFLPSFFPLSNLKKATAPWPFPLLPAGQSCFPQDRPGSYRNPYRNLYIGLHTKVAVPQIPKWPCFSYQSGRG